LKHSGWFCEIFLQDKNLLFVIIWPPNSSILILID